ncbi:MAG: hypothetical protein M9933_01215 [Chitinophagaceae bacterium]|nr:hypothetical protein [Chitinophagaceae bacterium]
MLSQMNGGKIESAIFTEFIEKGQTNVIDSFEGTEIEQPVSPFYAKTKGLGIPPPDIKKLIFEEYK